MTVDQLPAVPALFGFVLFLGGTPHVDLAARLRHAGVTGMLDRRITDRVAVLVVRPGRSLAEAALAAEAELQDVIGSNSWVLLCPVCEMPLAGTEAGFSCAEHGPTAETGELVSDVAEVPAGRPSRRPSRHRIRSVHKRSSLGAGWSKMLADQAVSQRPALWLAVTESGAVSGFWPAATHAEVVQAQADLAALLTAEQARAQRSSS
jgi:hypothetical protein